MTLEIETIFLKEDGTSYDHVLPLRLQRKLTPSSEYENIPLQEVAKIELVIGAVVIENEDPSEFPVKWDENETGEDGVVLISLGGQGLAAGEYYAHLILYDTDHPNGLPVSGARGIPLRVVVI
jgi:hypothetical protein